MVHRAAIGGNGARQGGCERIVRTVEIDVAIISSNCTASINLAARDGDVTRNIDWMVALFITTSPPALAVMVTSLFAVISIGSQGNVTATCNRCIGSSSGNSVTVKVTQHRYIVSCRDSQVTGRSRGEIASCHIITRDSDVV